MLQIVRIGLRECSSAGFSNKWGSHDFEGIPNYDGTERTWNTQGESLLTWYLLVTLDPDQTWRRKVHGALSVKG